MWEPPRWLEIFGDIYFLEIFGDIYFLTVIQILENIWSCIFFKTTE